jgi:hypothetical protein
MGQTALLPLRRKACCGFFRPENPTASTGLEPAILGTRGQHAYCYSRSRYERHLVLSSSRGNLLMWGHNVNMAAGHVEFILYDKNSNLDDDLNSEVKLTCLLYKVSVNVKVFIGRK